MSILLLSLLCFLLLRYALKKLCSARTSHNVADDRITIEKQLPLPPGTMGWPYIGETFQLYSARDPKVFFNHKQKRYGPVFKTHILGCPCVMVSSPEAAKFVLVTKAHLFKPTFPASKERMLGPQAIFFQQGEYHVRLRRLVLRAFMPDAIRSRVPSVENIARSTLRSWEGRTVNTFREMKTVRTLSNLLSPFLLCFSFPFFPLFSAYIYGVAVLLLTFPFS